MNKALIHLAVTVICCVACIVSCEGINVREQVDGKVWEATAPEARVIPNVLAGTGVITPSGVGVSGGAYLAKQHIAFDVSYNLTNADYAFIRWEAHEGDVRDSYVWPAAATAQTQAAALAPNRFLIQSEGDRPTSARITSHLDGGAVTLTPVVAPRPRVVSFQPDGGTSTPAILNTPIVIQFSAAVRLSSVSYGWKDGAPVWRQPAAEKPDGAFKNISITGRGTFGAGQSEPFEKYFNDPSFDASGTILTFTVNKTKMDEGKPYFSYIYVDLGADIEADGTETVTLGTPAHFQYAIEDAEDKTGPVVTLAQASASEAEYLPIAQPLAAGSRIYLIVSAYDAIDKIALQNISLKYRMGAETYNDYAVVGLYSVNRYNSAAYAVLQNGVEARHGNLPGVMYVIPFTVPPTSAASVLEIIPMVSDLSGNSSLPNGGEAAARKISLEVNP